MHSLLVSNFEAEATITIEQAFSCLVVQAEVCFYKLELFHLDGIKKYAPPIAAFWMKRVPALLS